MVWAFGNLAPRVSPALCHAVPQTTISSAWVETSLKQTRDALKLWETLEFDVFHHRWTTHDPIWNETCRHMKAIFFCRDLRSRTKINLNQICILSIPQNSEFFIYFAFCISNTCFVSESVTIHNNCNMFKLARKLSFVQENQYSSSVTFHPLSWVPNYVFWRLYIKIENYHYSE